MPRHPDTSPADEAFLDDVQRHAFSYFVEACNPANGLIADTTRLGSPSSIAVVGFGLASFPVAVSRGWIGRDDAVHRCITVLRFFRDSDQSGTPASTGHKGFYYHFLDMLTGLRVWQSELSMIDTALLLAGALTAAAGFDADTPGERELRDLAHDLYCRADWQWALGGECTIRQGWKPEVGFLHYGWEGYSEAILLYALALGSPTYPLAPSGYKGWTSTYQWENQYGVDVLYAGPLFVHQFSHAWIDLRGIRDAFMREKQTDYFENSAHAVRIQRTYAQKNPHGFEGYGPDCWGLSACDGPTDERIDVLNEPRRLFGYTARGVPYGPDDGTLSVAAALASLPFAPEAALRAARTMLERHPEIRSEGRFTGAFNPSNLQPGGRAWVSPGHYGLDQGILVLMIENHRTGLVWRLMRSCPWLADGLVRAGFSGGWLAGSAA